MTSLDQIESFDSTKHFITLEKNGLQLVDKTFSQKLRKFFSFSNKYDSVAIANFIMLNYGDNPQAAHNKGLNNFFQKMGKHKLSSSQSRSAYLRLQYVFDERVKKLKQNQPLDTLDLINRYANIVTDYDFAFSSARTMVSCHPDYASIVDKEIRQTIYQLATETLRHLHES